MMCVWTCNGGERWEDWEEGIAGVEGNRGRMGWDGRREGEWRPAALGRIGLVDDRRR
jgi:hypothetical protein